MNDKSAIPGVHGVALRWHGYSLMDCCDYGIIGNSRLCMYELDYAGAARARRARHWCEFHIDLNQPRKNLFWSLEELRRQ
jgi:hypothetical protein